MKFQSFPIVAGVAILGIVNARAAYMPTPTSELFVTADTSLQYNDNILLGQDSTKSDEIFTIAPGLLINWGTGSDFKGTASFNEDFVNYFSNSDLDASLAQANFSSIYEDGVSTVNVLASYHQVDQATRDVRGANSLIDRDLTHAEINGETALSANTSVKLGFAYDDTNYRPVNFTDWEWIAVPIDYYYKVAPKLDLSAGFRFKDNQLGAGGINSNEYFYSIGARGELAPKLTGEFSFGVDSRTLNGHGTTTEPGLEANFTYLATPKTTVTFGANNDYGYGADGGAYKVTGLNAGVEAVISSALKFDGLLSYGHYEYSTESRVDDFYQAQASATYTVNQYISVTCAYAYAENSSNISGDSFKNNVFSIGASFRY